MEPSPPFSFIRFMLAAFLVISSMCVRSNSEGSPRCDGFSISALNDMDMKGLEKTGSGAEIVRPKSHAPIKSRPDTEEVEEWTSWLSSSIMSSAKGRSGW
mgnify:FL=1